MFPQTPPFRRLRRAVGRVLLVSLAVLVVVGAVPPLRHAALHGATAAALGVAVQWAPAVPPFDSLAATTQIVAADGRLLATLHQEDRRPLRLADIPVPVRRAFLAAEDQNFYDHGGIDPVAVGRAAWGNLRGGRQGGSTITQQLAKTNFTTGERSFDRKFDEALIAAVLERRHTKDELLERYLNQVYFGERAYRLASAARTFFGAEPAGLTVGQAATLAGKIRAPARLDPRTGPAAVIRRRDAVLANMAEEDWLTATELAAARAEPLRLAPPQSRGTLLAPHFVELVKREAKTFEALGEMLVPPLFALLLGVTSMATRPDRSFVTLVAAQSMPRAALLLGSFLGLAGALWLTLLLGAGLSALILAGAAAAGDLAPLAALAGATLITSTACLAIGVALAALASSRSQATALGVAVWFVLTLGMDLALTGLVPALHLGPRGMLAALLVNPVESGRILALLGGDGTSGFGTFGGYLRDSLGVTAAAGLLLASLTAWIVTPLAAATAALTRRDL